MAKKKNLDELRYSENNPAPFVENNPRFIYTADGVNPIYVDNNTGEVFQQGKPKGTVVLPDVVVKSPNLKAKEHFEKQFATSPYKNEKGLENPIVDPFLAIAGGVRGIGSALDLAMPSTPIEQITGLPMGIAVNKGIQRLTPELNAFITSHINLPVKRKRTLALPYYPQNNNNIIELPSSGKIIKLGNREYNENRAFIAKFNKWNRRYGYPSLSTSLAESSEALDNAIKERLLQHNTFLRGVAIDENNPGIDLLKAKLKDEGIEPTNENLLIALSTRYLPEGDIKGRAGFKYIPLVKQYNATNENIKETYRNLGSIYASNALDQAVGYAQRLGRHRLQGVYKVRRPIEFNGSREDWVLNAEFPFANNRNSTTYQEYELPYLMRYGVSPKESRFDVDKYENLMRDWVKAHSNDNIDDPFNYGPAKYLRQKFYKNNADLSEINFRTGTPFDYYRNDIINKLINNRVFPKYTQDETDMINTYSIPWLIKKGLSYNEAVDEVSKFVNSKRFNDSVYKYYKKQQNKAIKQAKRSAIKYLNNKEIKEKVTKAGVVPNKTIDNIGTSERMRTTTINKGNPFQHFIFAGEPYEQGLEFVERIPYKVWKDIQGSTAHRGHWYPGTSRKSKKQGGSINLDELYLT